MPLVDTQQFTANEATSTDHREIQDEETVATFFKNIFAKTDSKVGETMSSVRDDDKTKCGQHDINDGDGNFDCNICLDQAKDAVVSMCGHLFCWACLYHWLELKPTSQTCPVCKAAISKDKVSPIYGRGKEAVDPRDKVPPRPAGTRIEPEPTTSFPGFSLADTSGFHMSVGFGSFPFGFFSTEFYTYGDANSSNENASSRIFLLLAVILFFYYTC